MEGRPARAWAPLVFDPRHAPGGLDANVIGRLKPGRGARRGSGRLIRRPGVARCGVPQSIRDRRVIVRDFQRRCSAASVPGLRMLTVIVALLLFIACANAANLFLGRAAAHMRDIALRTAVGREPRHAWSPRRSARASSSPLAAALLGLLLAFWGTRFVWSHAGPPVHPDRRQRLRVRQPRRPLRFGPHGFTVILFGDAPRASRLSRRHLTEVFQIGHASLRRTTVAGPSPRALVIVQVPCTVTLVLTTLIIRSFSPLLAGVGTTRGSIPARLTVATLPASGMPSSIRPSPGSRRFAAIEHRLAAVPAVEQVAITSAPAISPARVAVARRRARPTPPARCRGSSVDCAPSMPPTSPSRRLSVKGRGVTTQDSGRRSRGRHRRVVGQRQLVTVRDPIGRPCVASTACRADHRRRRARQIPTAPFRPSLGGVHPLHADGCRRGDAAGAVPSLSRSRRRRRCARRSAAVDPDHR